MSSWVLQDCKYLLFLYKKCYILERSVQTFERMWILIILISHGSGCSWIQDWNEVICFINSQSPCLCRPGDWDQRLQHGLLIREREHKTSCNPILFLQNSFSSHLCFTLQNITSKDHCSSLGAQMTQLQNQALSCESGKTENPKLIFWAIFGRIGQVTSESFWYYTLDMGV